MPNQMTASELKNSMRCLLEIFLEQIKKDETIDEIKRDEVSLHAQLCGLIDKRFDQIKEN